jgi:antimicrobial peptide system SdpB family protein
MYKSIENRILGTVATYQPWTNVYGLARSVLAFSTAATLAANAPQTLFRPGSGTAVPPFCDGMRAVSAFCIAPRSELPLVRWVCVAALLVVASGWRPRFTGLLHWWISFSFQASAMVLDGGDQVAAVLSLLLVPITLTDRRPWHWAPPSEAPLSQEEVHRRLWAKLGHWLVRLQVAGIYLHASLGKLTVPEWRDGTALFYWGTHETFGVPAWLIPVFRPILVHGSSVSVLTWSVILLELSLSAAFLMEARFQKILMWAGMTMHLGIIVVHGLPSFSFMMLGALLLYLRPFQAELKWASRLAWAVGRVREKGPQYGPSPAPARHALRGSETG